MTTNIRVVRYTTHPEAVEENIRLVAAVYEQLEATESETFRYATMLHPEENSFLHLAIAYDDRPPLPELTAFQEFQRGIASRAIAPVKASTAAIVGNYRLL